MTSSPPRGPNLAIAGALSGFAQVLAEQPFDTIKVRLQSRALSFDVYSGPLSLARATWSKEGARAFFQGVTPRLATYSLVKASLFSLFEHFYTLTGSATVAGGIAGGMNTLLSCPADVLKSRLQVQVATKGPYRGPLGTAQHLLRAHGPRGLFTGWSALVARDVPGYALLYTIYMHGRASPTLSWVPTWAIGGTSGVGFYMLTLPIDRAKTVLMTQALGEKLPVAKGAGRNGAASGLPRSLSAALGAIVRDEGVMGLYRGCVPTLARTFVGQAVALTAYERAKCLF